MQVRPSRQFRGSTFWAMALLLTGAVLACYWPVLQGGLLWDDPAHVTKPELRSWFGLVRIWTDVGAAQQYYPVLHTAFWIEHRLWGDATFGYHLTNVLLHAVSCCLLALVLRRLWTSGADPSAPESSTHRRVPAGAAWLAALLLAVHPVCVESVAWISEQKNTLSLVFYLSAALAYGRFAQQPRLRSYWLASGLFLLALGTKTMTATLPAALLVVLWWKHGRLSWRRDALPLLPWFFAAAVAGLFTVWVEKHVIGADGAAYDLSLVERVLLAGRIVWFYIGKLIWPADLSFFYPRWNVPAAATAWLAYLAATIAVTGVCWAIRRRSRGPLAGWLLFVGGLFPALGFFNVYPFLFSYVADHFQYLASVSFIAGLAAGAALLLSRVPPAARTAGHVALGIIVVTLAVLTHRQSRIYRDNETLFRDTLARNPDSWMAHHILGVTLSRTPARQLEAIRHYEAALRLNPEHPDSHLGLGAELARLPGRSAEAIAHYQRALQLRPNYAEAHNNLAFELAKQPGRLAEVIAHCEAALRVRPKLPEAHANLAAALARSPGRLSDALVHYQEALRLRPDYPEAHNNLGRELARLPGRLPEAIVHFEAALNLSPEYAEAHHNLADALADSPGRGAAAVPHYEAALRLNPDSAGTHYNLASVLIALPGRLPDAISHLEAALRLKPDFAEAHANLANVLAALPGRLPEAIAHDQAALRIDPSLAWVHHNLSVHLSQLPGREAEAIAHGETAISLQPEYLEAHVHLGALQAGLGRREQAKASWEKALQIDPGDAAARANLRLLEASDDR